MSKHVELNYLGLFKCTFCFKTQLNLILTWSTPILIYYSDDSVYETHSEIFRFKNSLKFYAMLIFLIHLKMDYIFTTFSVKFTATGKGNTFKSEQIFRVSSCLSYTVKNWIEVYEDAGRIRTSKNITTFCLTYLVHW